MQKIPQDVHSLTPRTCDYVTWYGKRDFADVIKGIEFEIWKVSWIIQVGLI